jgi:hypothetical protein
MQTLIRISISLAFSACLAGQGAFFLGSNFSSSVANTWSLPNSQSNLCNSTCGSSLSAPAFSAPLTSGDLIIVGIFNLPVSTITISDTAGNTYSDSGAGFTPYFGSTRGIQVFCGTTTTTTASNVVTMNISGTLQFPRIIATELHNTTGSLSCPSNIDAFANNPNAMGSTTPNALTSGSVTPSVNGDLVYALYNSDAGISSVGTSPVAFTLIANVGAPGMTAEYAVQATAGAINPTATNAASVDQAYAGITVALKP